MSLDPAALTSALAARIDGVEVTLTRQARVMTELRGDVASLADGMKRLLKAAGDDEDGQPNWLLTSDPDAAVELLLGAITWHDTFLPWLGAGMPGPCWPWHPAVVVDVLALAEQYQAAYASPDPAKVSDLLTRWLPSFRARTCGGVNGKPGAMGLCNRHEHHVGDGRVCTAQLDQLDTYARWWALDRTTSGMPPGLIERPS